LHWLLGSNYFQHAHCNDDSEFDYARNFTGLVNVFWMNIGFHTAHHDNPRAHWSTLRKIHQENQDNVDPSLCCDSFLVYVFKVFIMGSFSRSWRTESLRSKPDIS